MYLHVSRCKCLTYARGTTALVSLRRVKISHRAVYLTILLALQEEVQICTCTCTGRLVHGYGEWIRHAVLPSLNRLIGEMWHREVQATTIVVAMGRCRVYGEEYDQSLFAKTSGNEVHLDNLIEAFKPEI